MTTLLDLGDVCLAVQFFADLIAFEILEWGWLRLRTASEGGPYNKEAAHKRTVTHESECLDGSAALNDANEDDD